MKVSEEQVMVAKGMVGRGVSVRGLAEQLGVTEGALRYRLKRLGAPERADGRSQQPTALDGRRRTWRRSRNDWMTGV